MGAPVGKKDPKRSAGVRNIHGDPRKVPDRVKSGGGTVRELTPAEAGSYKPGTGGTVVDARKFATKEVLKNFQTIAGGQEMAQTGISGGFQRRRIAGRRGPGVDFNSAVKDYMSKIPQMDANRREISNLDPVERKRVVDSSSGGGVLTKWGGGNVRDGTQVSMDDLARRLHSLKPGEGFLNPDGTANLRLVSKHLREQR